MIAGQQALAAYVAFTKAANAAYQAGDPHSPDLGKYSTDTALSQTRSDLFELQRLGIVYRGEPSNSPRIDRVELTGPVPTVFVVDCFDNAGWQPVYKSSGKSAAAPGQHPRVPVTASVERLGSSWLVVKTKADRNQTC